MLNFQMQQKIICHSDFWEKIFKCEKLCAVDNDDDEGRHKMMTHDKLTTQKSESWQDFWLIACWKPNNTEYNHDITEILLKVVLNTINPLPNQNH